MKVVETGYKLDLHIHSIYSKGKDHGKVNYNTLDNIGTLVEKLNEQNVQLCALTDHDAFNFNMYKALKEYESKDYSVLKVFPGVEFSVEFEGDTENVVVHVIAIFDDSDEAKIQKIENILQGSEGKPVYDRHLAFSEEKFLSILRDISLDTILIAHQKGSLTSKNAKKSDANTVGEEKFQEFLYTDFFEAYEFKNKKNEIFNKNYIFSNGVEDELRFVTGSDCHDWRFYPQEDEKDTSEFSYTYVKCLPTFRGLVMAVTDYRRIKTVNSFFNPTEFFLPEIKMMINGLEKTIPLSRGLNVIIGDNSIGKSLLLHKLTNYTKKKDRLLKGKVITGYDNYLKENGGWRGNAEVLYDKGIPLNELISCREDVYAYLYDKLNGKCCENPSGQVYDIKESVRKGKYSNNRMPAEIEKLLLECDVPKWYIESMKKILYLFPKTHLIVLLKRDICKYIVMNNS